MTLPNVDMNLIDQPTLEKVQAQALNHAPRILLLYGSNRERSYSRLAVMEAGRILEHFGAEVKIFHSKRYRNVSINAIYNVYRYTVIKKIASS